MLRNHLYWHVSRQRLLLGCECLRLQGFRRITTSGLVKNAQVEVLDDELRRVAGNTISVPAIGSLLGVVISSRSCISFVMGGDVRPLARRVQPSMKGHHPKFGMSLKSWSFIKVQQIDSYCFWCVPQLLQVQLSALRAPLGGRECVLGLPPIPPRHRRLWRQCKHPGMGQANFERVAETSSRGSHGKQ